jgi:hypothetical protein
VIIPPGTAALPLAPFAIVELVESNVPSEVVHVGPLQISKVILPVSFGSGSPNVAVNVGVDVFTRALLAGVTSAGAFGARSAVLFVTATPVAVAAGFPVGVAASRTIGSLPGFV